MVKIKNKRKLKWCLKNYNSGKITQKWASQYLKITPRRFRQINTQYKCTENVPEIGINIGRPKKQIPDNWKSVIKQEYEKDRLNALYLEKTIYARYKIRIPHNTIHSVMLESGFAREQESKQKRRKPWIRYERKHSLSAVHTDWYENKSTGKQICTVLDDAARKILAAREFDNATEENALIVLKEAMERTMHLYPLGSVICDHGSQFYANKRDKKDHADHAFEKFLMDNGIKQILCGVNHPQTNGKLEKLHDFYRVHRQRFDSMDKLVEWYNNRPHGALNLRRAETPNQAFVRKMRPEVWMGFAVKLFDW
jgi:putative transposase